ncbi:MAG: VOC family protein [Candidatus Saccharibacteria bacterium]
MFKEGIGFHFNVSNLERAIAFYSEKLGFKVLDHDPSRGQAMLSTNSKDCIIGLAEAEAVVPASTCITFEVANIDQAVQSLQERGIDFAGEIMIVPSVIKLATFYDPDGYKLMLFSHL